MNSVVFHRYAFPRALTLSDSLKGFLSFQSLPIEVSSILNGTRHNRHNHRRRTHRHTVRTLYLLLVVSCGDVIVIDAVRRHRHRDSRHEDAS